MTPRHRVVRFVLRVPLRALRALPRGVARRIQDLRPPYYQLGAAAIVVDDEGRWLVVRHSYRRGWGLPGGGLSGTESLDETVTRELREELGIDVALRPGVMFHEPGITHITAVFPAQLVSGEPEPLSIEIDEVAWMHPTEFGPTDRFLQVVAGALPNPLAGSDVRLITDR